MSDEPQLKYTSNLGPLPIAPDPDYMARSGFAAGHRIIIMSDQEIRARALECAVRLRVAQPPLMSDERLWVFWDDVSEFEDYIRNGK